MKWILRHVKGTADKGLVFDRNKAGTCDVTGFVDSDYAGDLDRRRSISGYIFTKVLFLRKHRYSLLQFYLLQRLSVLLLLKE